MTETVPKEDATAEATMSPAKVDRSASSRDQRAAELPEPHADTSNNLMVASAMIIYCVSGTALTLVNKLAVATLPAPYSLLLFQNGVTVALLWVLTSIIPDRMGGPLPPLDIAVLKSWFPLTLLFVGMLASSLLSLQSVTAVTLIVVRNLCTLLVAFLEFVLLRAPISSLSVFSLFGIFLGAILYGLGDINFSPVGYAWLTVNAACTAAFQIYLKSMMSTAGENSLAHFSMAYYNNVTSLPLLGLVAVCFGEFSHLSALVSSLSMYGWGIVILSAVFGFALSVSAFLVTRLVTATSMMVANNVNKFAVIILSELFVQSSLGPLAACGTAFVLFFGWLYAQSKGPLSSSDLSHGLCTKVGTRGFLAITLFLLSIIALAVSMFDSSNGFILMHPSIGIPLVYSSSPAIRRGVTNATSVYVGKYYRKFLPPQPHPGFQSYEKPTYYLSDADWASCPLASQEPGFKKICNVEGPCAGAPPAIDAYVDLPRETSWGESVEDAIHRTLGAAWGMHPPTIDLFLRTGCGAVTEMAYLLPTIELFWPDFLGDIIIVLDTGNHHSLEHFLPTRGNKTRHSYRFVYEDVPCIPARVFNQVSYLNADMHSKAQYIVTIDSDCALHSPVTPDLLFDDQGKLLLAHSVHFQAGLWDSDVNFFTGRGTSKAHSMVTQPVAFARETFAAYRAWMKSKPGGECYYDTVMRFLRDGRQITFCWMCQLSTFLEITGLTLERYNIVDMDDMRSNPRYQRYAIHTTYELDPRVISISSPNVNTDADSNVHYGPTSFLIVRDGICRALGDGIVPTCAGVPRNFIDHVTFSYAGFAWPHQDVDKLNTTISYFRQAEARSRRPVKTPLHPQNALQN